MTYTITNTDFIDNYIADPVTIVLNHFITINASTTDTNNDVVLYSAYGFHITLPVEFVNTTLSGDLSASTRTCPLPPSE